MKTLLLGLLVSTLSAIFFNVHGQTAYSQLSEQEVKDMICHKWQPVSMKENGKTIPMEKEDSTLYIIFRKDGTFIDYFEGDSPSNKWTYNHKTKTITMANEGKKIVRLDDKEMIMMYKPDGVPMILTLKRVD